MRSESFREKGRVQPSKPAPQVRPPKRSPIDRAWAFARSDLLRDPIGARVRDERYELMLVDARMRLGGEPTLDEQDLALSVWRRAWHEAFEEGRLAERRDG